jgi:hypothetical protein
MIITKKDKPQNVKATSDGGDKEKAKRSKVRLYEHIGHFLA